MHINWWPSSLKREAGSPAPIKKKTATQSSATRSALPSGPRIRDEFTDVGIFVTVDVTLIAGSYGNGGVHWFRHSDTYRGGSIGNQGKDCASDDDPNAQPDPHD